MRIVKNRPVLLAGLAVLLGLGVAGAALAAGLTSPAPGSTVLHFTASRTGEPSSAKVEVWLDLSTGEGKRVASRADGSATLVEGIAAGVSTLHVPREGSPGFAVIRRGIAPGTPASQQLRDRVFMYRTALERGVARSVGTGRVDGRATERVEFQIEGQPIIADLDQETGLPLREEMPSPDGGSRVIETTYHAIEHVPRSRVPASVFTVELPEGVHREEYTEGPPASRPSDTAPLPYAVYGVPSLGEPVHQERVASNTGPSGRDTYYVIYLVEGREIQVLSGLPPDLSPNVGKTEPVSRKESVEIARRQWVLDLTSLPHGPVRAEAHLEDAYVTIHGPDRAAVEQAAAGLTRIAPRR